jgi:hypothetical protein
VFTNLMTILFLFCWCLFRRPSALQNHSKINISGISSEKESSSARSPSEFTSSRDNEELRPSIRTSKPQLARRVTEIELFQPRYNLPLL